MHSHRNSTRSTKKPVDADSIRLLRAHLARYRYLLTRARPLVQAWAMDGAPEAAEVLEAIDAELEVFVA